ncbi:MAG: ATP-binding protein [Betaproteobacteria bacterium]
MIRHAIAFLVSLLLACATGHAQNLRVERAYLHDPSASFTQADLATLPFAAFSGTLNLGITTGTTWIRLTIERERGGDEGVWEPQTVRVGPSPLLRVQVAQAPVGTALPASAFAPMVRCPDHLLCADLRGPVAQPVQVYLKVEGRGIRLISVDVLQADALMRRVMAQAAGIYASLTIAFGLVFVSLFLLLMDRSALTLAYLAFQVSALVVMVGISGMLWPSWIDEELLTSNLFFLWPIRTAMTVLLFYFLIRPYQRSQLLRVAVWVLLGGCAFNLLLMGLGQFRLALISNVVIFILNPVIHVLAVAMASSMRASLRSVMVLGGLIFLGLIAYFSAVGGSGVQHFGDWRLNGMYISLFTFVCVMMERNHLAAIKNRQLEQLRLEGANSRQLDAQLRDRQSLIDMLTHELKNPLATIRFALSSLRAGAGSDAHMHKRLNSIGSSAARMDKVLEHVALVNQIEMSQVPTTPTVSHAAEVVGQVLAQMELSRAIDIDIQADSYFSGDAQMIRTILENLLRNADAYGLPEQATLLRVGSDAAFTELEVSNAVAADAMPDETRIFERYYRHSSSLRLPGMGIGLSLVKTCVEKLGGTINFLQRNHSVVFLVRLPN